VLAIGWTLWRGTLPAEPAARRRRALATALVLITLAALQGLGNAVMAGRTALR
jgi:hypothetical protein